MFSFSISFLYTTVVAAKVQIFLKLRKKVYNKMVVLIHLLSVKSYQINKKSFPKAGKLFLFIFFIKSISPSAALSYLALNKLGT